MCSQGCRFCLFLQLLLFYWILEHFCQSVFLVFFFFIQNCFNSFLLWKLHLKFVLNDNPTSLKVPDLYLSDVRLAHSFPKSPCSLHPPFVYHNTRLWSCPNWCDLKSVQLYVLSYPFDNVKCYVIIFCHA